MILPDRFSVTPEERERLGHIERLVADGTAGIAPLVDLLDDPSWTVRRAVVAGLAAGGDAVVAPLCQALGHRRDNEGRIAATVDALAALNADVDARLAAMADDPDPALVADVAQILGRRRATAALPTLVALTPPSSERHRRRGRPSRLLVGWAVRAAGRLDWSTRSGAGNFFSDLLPQSTSSAAAVSRARWSRSARCSVNRSMRPRRRGPWGEPGDRAAVLALMPLLGRGAGAMVRVAAVALKELRQRNAEHFGSGERIEEAIAEAGGGGGIVRQVVRALSDGDSAEKAALCFVLSVLRDTSTVPALTALLDGPVEVVEAASEALKRIGPGADRQILHEIRSGGAKRALLPLVSHTMAAAEVLACLADPEADVRALACEALGRMGASDAVTALFPLLADPHPGVAFAALGAIQALGGRQIERLTLAALKSPEARVRRAAVRILAYFGFEGSLDPLLGALADPDERVREAALQGLPIFDDLRAREALLAAAKDPVDRTRAVAMRALGQCVGDIRVSAYLIRGLSDSDPWTRYYACQALGRLAFEPAAEAIGRLLADPAGQVRVAAVEALAFLKSEAALLALEGAIADAEPDVQRAALMGLGVARRIESLPRMLAATKATDPATRIVALSAIAAFRSPDVLHALVEGAVDPDAEVSTVAIGLLSAIPGAAATTELANILRRSRSREQIVSALSVHVEGRVSGLSSALESADDETAGALTSALARMRRPDATAALLGTMTSSNSPARKAAATTLAGLGQPDALAILRVAVANDPDPEVRRICSLLLSR